MRCLFFSRLVMSLKIGKIFRLSQKQKKQNENRQSVCNDKYRQHWHFSYGKWRENNFISIYQCWHLGLNLTSGKMNFYWFLNQVVIPYDVSWIALKSSFHQGKFFYELCRQNFTCPCRISRGRCFSGLGNITYVFCCWVKVTFSGWIWINFNNFRVQ